MEPTEDFEDGQAFETPSGDNAFIVDLEGFEGPIDVLLGMARNQKVDLAHISILALANQYLKFVEQARRQNLELAADYLVMAAWLAYLKSKMLLPDMGNEDEPTGDEMAAALQFQLRRLQSMQDAGSHLVKRSRLGKDFFKRGEVEKFRTSVNTIYELSLFELLKAYGEQKRRKEGTGAMQIASFEIYTVEDALQRLRKLLGPIPAWQNLWSFLPEGLKDGLITRSAVASTFAASLELAKEGRLSVRQTETYGAIHIKPGIRNNEPANDADNTADQPPAPNEDEDEDE
ncbi:MAG: segregation/condensation protein A [Rhodospirillales bacterium]|nr:segregation/condensation protein A [Rhodospirillales bacterium]